MQSLDTSVLGAQPPTNRAPLLGTLVALALSTATSVAVAQPAPQPVPPAAQPAPQPVPPVAQPVPAVAQPLPPPMPLPPGPVPGQAFPGGPPLPPPGAPAGESMPPVPPPVLPPPVVETLTGGDAPTRVGDFMDTRLSWTFGTDDVLHATGLAYPLSQSFNVGDRPQYRLFFDSLNSRFSDRENLTHLALYKKMPGFIKNLDTEASATIRLDLNQLGSNSNNLNQAIYDAGSFIRLFYHTNGNPDGHVGLGLTLWPVDTDRFRLGYLYTLSWGGTASYINESIFPGIQGSAPGGKLSYDGDRWGVFFGFKTALISQAQQTFAPGTNQIEEITIQQTNVGLLAGGNVDITENVRLDVNGGYFQQGKFDLPDVFGQSIYTFGGSARLFIHDKDWLVPESIDFRLYRNDPNKPMVIFKPVAYTPGKTMWAITAEYDNLWQNLKDFDKAGATNLQQARAAAVQADIKSGFFRVEGTFLYRDLAYVLRNQPSFIPFETMPKDAVTTPEASSGR